ncbi:MAG: type II toxin-antitoxin system VapC family toxin [Candidatus Promineifilaceae bacterium]|nr:type II toxin-antitoxin system VapC family toxin [Candidatus Promineifilaceae bacterium]
MLNLAASVLAECIELLENNILRGLDALHIACALVWQADLFVTADGRQLSAAQQVGLPVTSVTGADYD